MKAKTLLAACLVTGGTLAGSGATAAPRIDAPINGAQAGTWQYFTLANGFNYDVLLPYGYTTNYIYPVVLYLHGLSTEAPPGQPPNNAFPEIINNTNVNGVNYRANYPAIIVAPQCANSAFGSNDWGGTWTYWDTTNNTVQNQIDMPCGDNAMTALKTVLKTYSADLSRVYIAGYSMGGFGTDYLYLKHRWLFAAAIPVSGAIYGGLTQAEYQKKIGTHPFWAFHGAQDTTVPPGWDEQMYLTSQSSGGAMLYDEFVSPGVHSNFPSITVYYGDGHAAADVYAYSYQPAMNWLLSQINQNPPTIKQLNSLIR